MQGGRKERKKGKRGTRKCIEEGKSEGRQRSKPRELAAPPAPPSSWTGSQSCTGVWAQGGCRDPGRRAECLRDVFIP